MALPPAAPLNGHRSHGVINANMAVGASPDLDLLGHRCESCFKRLYAALNDPVSTFRNELSPMEVQDELGRFKIWARNIGALQPRTMSSSLEYRLRDASHARQLVVKLLGNLQEALEECRAS